MTTQQPQGPGRRRRTLITAGAIGVPVITALAVAVPLLTDLGTKRTSPDSVAVISSEPSPIPTPTATAIERADEASPAQTESATQVSQTIGEETQWPQGDLDWAIPVTAPIASFPTGTVVDAGCTPEQLAWLNQHAHHAETSDTLFLTLHNTAASGGALPLGNIRFEGSEVPAGAWVRFECRSGGRGDGGGMQPMLLHTDGSSALYGEAMFVDDDSKPTGSPVVINLSPGELAQVPLTRHQDVDTQRAYEGRILADPLDGSGTTVSLADDVQFKRDPLPGYFLGYGPQHDEFQCGRPDPAGINEWGRVPAINTTCTAQEAATLLLEANAQASVQ